MKLNYKIHYIGNLTNLRHFMYLHDIDPECITKVFYYTVMTSPKVFQRKFNLKGIIPGNSVVVLENKFLLSVVEIENIKSEGAIIVKEENFCPSLDQTHSIIVEPIYIEPITRFDLLDIP